MMPILGSLSILALRNATTSRNSMCGQHPDESRTKSRGNENLLLNFQI